MLETIEGEITESTVPLLAVRLEIIDGYWLRFQKAQSSLLVDFAHSDEISCTMSEVERSTQLMYTAAKAKLLQERSKLTIEQTKPRALRPSEMSGQLGAFNLRQRY